MTSQINATIILQTTNVTKERCHETKGTFFSLSTLALTPAFLKRMWIRKKKRKPVHLQLVNCARKQSLTSKKKRKDQAKPGSTEVAQSPAIASSGNTSEPRKSIDPVTPRVPEASQGLVSNSFQRKTKPAVNSAPENKNVLA